MYFLLFRKNFTHFSFTFNSIQFRVQKSTDKSFWQMEYFLRRVTNVPLTAAHNNVNVKCILCSCAHSKPFWNVFAVWAMQMIISSWKWISFKIRSLGGTVSFNLPNGMINNTAKYSKFNFHFYFEFRYRFVLYEKVYYLETENQKTIILLIRKLPIWNHFERNPSNRNSSND